MLGDAKRTGLGMRIVGHGVGVFLGKFTCGWGTGKAKRPSYWQTPEGRETDEWDTEGDAQEESPGDGGPEEGGGGHKEAELGSDATGRAKMREIGLARHRKIREGAGPQWRNLPDRQLHQPNKGQPSTA